MAYTPSNISDEELNKRFAAIDEQSYNLQPALYPESALFGAEPTLKQPDISVAPSSKPPTSLLRDQLIFEPPKNALGLGSEIAPMEPEAFQLQRGKLFEGFRPSPTKQPDITPAPVRQADAKAGVTIDKETEPVAPKMGAGGDEGPDRLAITEALSRGLGAIHEGVTGQKLATGIPEMLATLRQRREAQALKEGEIAREEKRTREEMDLRRETLRRDVEKAAAQQALKDRQAGIDPESTQQRLEYAASVEPEDKEFARLLRAGPIKGNDFVRARKEWENLNLLQARKKTEEMRPEAMLARTEKTKAERDAIYKRLALDGQRLALDERKMLSDANKQADPTKKLESLNKIADEKQFGGFRTMVSDLQAVESAAPGFVTEGKVPSWLTPAQMQLAQTVPAFADEKVVRFVSALANLKNEERHRLYGSAQTEGELRAFLQQLNDSPFSAGPQVLARQVGMLAQKASDKATGRIKRYNEVYGADNVDSVLGEEWRGFFDKGGVLSNKPLPFQTTQAAAPAPQGEQPARRPGAAAIAKLKADPSDANKAYFDRYFGTGAAAAALGGE